MGLPDGTLGYVAPTGNAWSDRAWGGQKVLWVVDPAVVEDVLVRGYQLDGPHQLAFGDPASPQLVLPVDGGAKSGTWRDYPGYTRLQAPGCYAYLVQVGTATTVLVFKAEGPVVGSG